MYDIIFIGTKDHPAFLNLKERFPTAKSATSITEAVSRSFTKLFWVVWPDLDIVQNFKFSYNVPEWDKQYVHVFKNGNYYDGVCLISKTSVPSEREFQHRFFINKKEVDILASNPRPFDIVFISYFEEYAEVNYQRLKEKTGHTHRIFRVDGIKGIHNAHQAAAMLSTSNMFWVVDADATIVDSFKFNFQIPAWNFDSVYVWKSMNPVNDLSYGYGGVKLLPKKLTLEMDRTTTDMTTSISKKFNVVDEVSNFTTFNTDPFSTWKSAFRECVKLSSNVINRHNPAETEANLNIWCTTGADRPYGEYAIKGALAGKKYGQENAGNIPALSLINDFNWLKIQYEQTLEPLETLQQ